MQSGKALHGIWIFGIVSDDEIIAKRKSPAVPLDLHQAVREALEQKDTDMQDEWTLCIYYINADSYMIKVNNCKKRKAILKARQKRATGGAHSQTLKTVRSGFDCYVK